MNTLIMQSMTSGNSFTIDAEVSRMLPAFPHLCEEEIVEVYKDYQIFNSTVCSECREHLTDDKLQVRMICNGDLNTPPYYGHACPYCNRDTELDKENIFEFERRFYA